MKQEIALEIEKMLEVKPINEVTIKEITNNLSISRQAFYYHYTDIYQATGDYYANSLKTLLDNCYSYDNMSCWYLVFLNWLKSKKKSVLNIYKTLTDDRIIHYLYEIIYPYIENGVYMQTSKIECNECNRKFIARTYTLSLIILTLGWFRFGMKETPELYSKMLSIFFDNDFSKALRQLENIN